LTHHPDCGVKVAGRRVPIEAMQRLCIDAHATLLPDVPMAGWDVALTNKGMLLLETNLSCNFFRGTFDEDKYFGFVHDYFSMLDQDVNHADLLQQRSACQKGRAFRRPSCVSTAESGNGSEPSDDASSAETPTPPDSDSDEGMHLRARGRSA